MPPRAVPRRPLFFAALLLSATVAPGDRIARAGDEPSPVARVPIPAPLTPDDVWGKPSRLRPLPSIAGWRPLSDAWVEWRGAGEGRALWQVDAATGEDEKLVSLADFEAEKPAGPGGVPVAVRGIGRGGPPSHLFSRNGDVVVLPLKGDLFHADLRTKARTRLTRNAASISDPRLSPDGRKVSFTRDHDLYAAVLEGETAREVRLTTGGSEDVLHGELDWVYPEELDCTTAAWWSPDSTRVAFLRLDQTGVPRVPVTDPEPLHGRVNWQRYPKAGDRNPLPGVGVVGLDGAPPVWLDLGADREIYVPWVAWWPDGSKVAVAILPRSQTRFEIRVFDAKGGAGTTFWSEEDPHWVDLPPPPRFLEKTPAMLLRSRRDGFWRHWLAPLDGKEPRALTPPGHEMGSLLAVDEEAGTLFLDGASEDRRRTTLWRGGLDGRDPVLAADASWHHSFSFSTTGRVFVDTSSRATEAPRASVRAADFRLLRALADSSCPEMESAIRVAPEFVSVPGAGGTSLDAVLWKPKDFDATRRWAVLVEVYGGPGSRMVRDAFSEKALLWRALLAQEGILSFSIDGRGTGLRGKAFETVVHKRLGLVETDDQVRGARWLASQPFVDPARIGISGWSYGGTMAALAVTKAGKGAFRAAVAGAGVMDWRLYDTIYTERYMGLPSKNVAGYEASSVVASAKSVSGSLLLLHGLLDDNVHVQNTVRLSDALIAAGKPFEQFLYPGAGHGGGGRAAQRDQDVRVLDFLRRHLDAGAGR